MPAELQSNAVNGLSERTLRMARGAIEMMLGARKYEEEQPFYLDEAYWAELRSALAEVNLALTHAICARVDDNINHEKK